MDLPTDMDAVLVPVKGNAAGRALGGMSRSSVYNLIRTGDLKLVKLGHRSFITTESIREYIKRRIYAA